jgi:transposase
MAQQMSVLGRDIAKLVLHVVGMDDTGHVVRRKRLARSELRPLIAQLPPLRIGMEACGSAHYWARCFREHGHEVRLIAPQFIRADVKSPENDARDAEAICAAVTRPTMRFVPIQRIEQQDLQALHRSRERLIKARTALVNEIRGLLNEDGIVVPQRITKFRPLIVSKLQHEQAKLTGLSTEVFWQLYEAFLNLAKRLAYDDEQLVAMAQAHPESQRLQTIPGIGPISATAILAAISDATQFKNGRQFAAWLGLVPRGHSTGGKPRLLGISQRGARYLRTLFVHGARATLRWVDSKHDERSRWLKALSARRGKNRAAVALATQNARMAWALLAHHQEYRVKTVVEAVGRSRCATPLRPDARGTLALMTR